MKVLGGEIAVRRYYRVMRQNASDVGKVLGISGAAQGYRGNSLYAAKGAVGNGSASKRGVWQFHRQWHDLILLDRNAALSNTSTDDLGNPLTQEQLLEQIKYI
ncbi:MAG: hypothetical protein ACI82Z_001695, partial [Cellvibrionaceae bacterium]